MSRPAPTGSPAPHAVSRGAARTGRLARWASTAALAALLAWMTWDARGFSALLRALAPGNTQVLYPGRSLPLLMRDQLYLTATASVISLALGLALGLLALSRPGRPFRDVLVAFANLAQTLPSVAVMALVVPLVGYGAEPALIALIAFSVLPVMLNVIAGIEGVPAATRDAAQGLGMSPLQRLLRVELPLAFPVILGATKNMVVINVSAATLGAVVAAGGLGMPILAGFHDFNTAFILEGALPAIVLALLLDRLLSFESAHEPVTLTE